MHCFVKHSFYAAHYVTCSFIVYSLYFTIWFAVPQSLLWDDKQKKIIIKVVAT